jgi:hypothetical protein
MTSDKVYSYRREIDARDGMISLYATYMSLAFTFSSHHLAMRVAVNIIFRVIQLDTDLKRSDTQGGQNRDSAAERRNG